MAEPKAGRQLVLSPAALQDIRDILLWSLDKFGSHAAERYRTLLLQALNDLKADPLRSGTRTRPELHENARIYHLASSRGSVKGERVRTPRHFILYRITSDNLEIARILHDSRDLARHLPEDYQA